MKGDTAMSVSELRALTQQFADAFDQRDLKPAIDMLAEDVEVFEVRSASVRRQADVYQARQRIL
jgi:ketosteroid isomerase-like protein